MKRRNKALELGSRGRHVRENTELECSWEICVSAAVRWENNRSSLELCLKKVNVKLMRKARGSSITRILFGSCTREMPDTKNIGEFTVNNMSVWRVPGGYIMETSAK